VSYLGLEQFEFTLRITTVVVPVALYFFILGFLNTRLHPQVLSGRQDFAILTAALSPLVFGPLTFYFGDNSALLMAGVVFLGLIGFLLVPRGRSLVIYNMSITESRKMVVRSLEQLGKTARINSAGVEIDDGRAIVEIACFPILRSVTLRFVKGDGEFWDGFEEILMGRIRNIDVIPRPMAVGLLLVATCMIVAPLSLVFKHAPEIVRLMENLVP